MVIDAAAKVGIQQGMYTLGGHLTRERAMFLAQRAAWVVVSLDAPDAETPMSADDDVPPLPSFPWV